MEVRRNVLYEGYQPSGNIIELFDGCSVTSNVYLTRKYQIVSNCKCIFYICEVYHAENIKECLNKQNQPIKWLVFVYLTASLILYLL